MPSLRAKRSNPWMLPKRMDCFVASLLAMTKMSIHPQKIPLADFDAVVAQDAVRGRGVEVEIRECEVVQELLAFQRHGRGTDRKSNVASVGAIELLGLERLHIGDGICKPLLQLIETLF